MIVYVGPTILGVATRNTTYSDIPESITAAADAAPYLLSLCVPLAALTETQRQIRNKEGAYWSFYKLALGYKPEQT